MSQFDSNKDYYGVLGVDKDASQVEIDRQYKRQACEASSGSWRQRRADEVVERGLRRSQRQVVAQLLRCQRRRRPATSQGFAPVTTPTARDVGVFGHCLSALLCLIAGMFLLLLVRFQWIWFLWPLAILALLVLGFGVLLARSAMVAVNASLPVTNPFKRHTRLQEAAFWAAIVSGGYGLYLVMTL